MSKKNKKKPDILQIRNKYQFWNDFVVPGMESKLPREMIRAQMLDAIRKEVFQQMCWRMKVINPDDAPQTPENEKIVESILKETRKKWAAVARMCNEHIATMNLISEEDLGTIWNEDEDDEDGGFEFTEAKDPEEEETDWDGNEATAEWPELNREMEMPPEEKDKQEEIPVIPGQEFPAGYWTR